MSSEPASGRRLAEVVEWARERLVIIRGYEAVVNQALKNIASAQSARRHPANTRRGRA